jgi:hypothetical protein
LPFYLTNEHIEATLERNPDDTFHPSDMNQAHSSKITKIRQLISEEIKNTFDTHTSKEVEYGLFCNVDSFKEDIKLSYLFTFETDNDEYEMTYHITSRLTDGIDINKEILLSLSNLIIESLNTQQDYAFLQDIELTDLCKQEIDYETTKTLQNLYSMSITIDKKEYIIYIQLDDQFNKTF